MARRSAALGMDRAEGGGHRSAPACTVADRRRHAEPEAGPCTCSPARRNSPRRRIVASQYGRGVDREHEAQGDEHAAHQHATIVKLFAVSCPASTQITSAGSHPDVSAAPRGGRHRDSTRETGQRGLVDRSLRRVDELASARFARFAQPASGGWRLATRFEATS